MKISIIGPALPIPPKGWGAVESLIWDYKLTLEKLNHEVQIVNLSDPNKIIQSVNNFQPDFVHINYDDWIVLYPYIQYPCAITSHFGYIERSNHMSGYVNIFNLFQNYKPNIFCLSENIKKVYKVLANIPEEKLYINPNGVNSSLFKKTNEPKYPDKSIYLAKVDYRKRQHLFQSIDSLWYAGNLADSRFDTNKNYLGEWDKDTLHEELTNYGNLVLLSDGEAHSLVVMEAFASGLGVVISEFATANLDLNKEFIDVIPENKINDINFIKNVITKNREYSVSHREEIFEYSKQFEWESIIQEYFLKNMKQVISNWVQK
jgi:glycosyltransferase involved in cell wall biosynthesis